MNMKRKIDVGSRVIIRNPLGSAFKYNGYMGYVIAVNRQGSGLTKYFLADNKTDKRGFVWAYPYELELI